MKDCSSRRRVFSPSILSGGDTHVRPQPGPELGLNFFRIHFGQLAQNGVRRDLSATGIRCAPHPLRFIRIHFGQLAQKPLRFTRIHSRKTECGAICQPQVFGARRTLCASLYRDRNRSHVMLPFQAKLGFVAALVGEGVLEQFDRLPRACSSSSSRALNPWKDCRTGPTVRFLC